MPKCVNCKYMKIMYAPFIKARVETCTKQGKCEEIITPSMKKERGNDLSQNEECLRRQS